MCSLRLFPKYGYADPPLRSGHLDIKETHCAKKKKFISRLGAAAAEKGRFGRPKIQLSSKVAKFSG